MRVSLQVREETKTRLTARMKYGDSIDDGINALLDIADEYDRINYELATKGDVVIEHNSDGSPVKPPEIKTEENKQ